MMAMKRLSKKWRKPRDDGFSLPTRDDPSLDDSRPMDTQEQEELVRSLEKSQALQSLCWRSVFAAFLFCFAAFLVYSIHQQATSPWELRYHAYFMEEAPSWMIIFADWIAVLACSMAIVGLIQNTRQHRQWLWYSCFTSVIPAMFWLYYLSRIPRFRWDVLWLPLGPIGWHLSICGLRAARILRRSEKTSRLHVCL
ncbi:uncharacterized protein LOC115740560 isoform X2 [Rhodamnia argentea]|uniref:Uncharacterized protein LOC115740560 isoform X2 n=1 Tax=Rhodamnia argentea TaxID=178133 RepID=A0ABM3HBF8_9MYRT|nr:uncharacterized protein LOC115740560 isoform X2 [Rhodamnia argentea]